MNKEEWSTYKNMQNEKKNKEIWGNIVSAILKYNNTRIGMRDQMGAILEEENKILKEKLELLNNSFKSEVDLLERKAQLLSNNLKEYEEIIEEEWLGEFTNTLKKAPAFEPKLEMLEKMFDSDDEVTIKDHTNQVADIVRQVFKPSIKRKTEANDMEVVGEWLEKRHSLSELMNSKQLTVGQKMELLKKSLMKANNPDDLITTFTKELEKIDICNVSDEQVENETQDKFTKFLDKVNGMINAGDHGGEPVDVDLMEAAKFSKKFQCDQQEESDKLLKKLNTSDGKDLLLETHVDKMLNPEELGEVPELEKERQHKKNKEDKILNGTSPGRSAFSRA